MVVAEYRGTSREFAAEESELREMVLATVTAEHAVRPAAVHLGPPGTIPTTTSGKVRRGAARDAYVEGGLKKLIVAPAPDAFLAGSTG